MPTLAAAVLLSALVVAPSVFAQVTVVSEGPFNPSGVQQFQLRSQRLGRDFIVVVTPPGNPIVPGMSAPGSGQKLPAVYALDGGYGVAGPMAQMLSMSGVSSPSYVVSIDYPPRMGQRNIDFLFQPVTEGGQTYGGGGAAFLAFLTDELRPFLEARFPIDPKRSVLLGHSFGGLFAANVLAEKPDAFSGYVIASASVWRDPNLPRRLAAAAPRVGDKRVLVAVGGREDARMQDSARQITDALKTTAPGLKMQSRVFEAGNHLSYYPQLAEAGIAWTLPSNVAGRVPTSVSPAALDRVVGVYRMPDGRQITVQRGSGALVAQITGLPGEGQFLAESSTRFFITSGFDVVMTFEGPETAPATAVLVNMAGAESRAPRAER